MFVKFAWAGGANVPFSAADVTTPLNTAPLVRPVKSPVMFTPEPRVSVPVTASWS